MPSNASSWKCTRADEAAFKWCKRADDAAAWKVIFNGYEYDARKRRTVWRVSSDAPASIVAFVSSISRRKREFSSSAARQRSSRLVTYRAFLALYSLCCAIDLLGGAVWSFLRPLVISNRRGGGSTCWVSSGSDIG